MATVINSNLKNFFVDFIKRFKYEILFFYFFVIAADACYMLASGYILKIITNSLNGGNFDIFQLCILYSFFVTLYPISRVFTKQIELIFDRKADKYYTLEYFSKILQYDIEYFSNILTGQLTTKLFNVKKKVRHIFKDLSDAISNFVIYIVGVMLFLFIDIKLFVFNVVWFIMYYILLVFILKWQFRVSDQNSEQKTKSFGIINDCFMNIMNIKIFSNEKKEYRQIKRQSLNILKSEGKMTLNKSVMDLFNYVMMGVMIFGSSGIVFYNYMGGNVSAGTTIFVITFTVRIVFWLNYSLRTLFDLIGAVSSINNSLNLLMTEIRVKNRTKDKLNVDDGKITFKNVSFSYNS